MHLKFNLRVPVDFYEAQDIKEKLCFITENYESSMGQSLSYAMIYEGATGKIDVSSERFKCPEIMFKPILLNRSRHNGLASAIQSSIDKCDRKWRNELRHNIVLSGGSTLFNGTT